MTLFITFFQNLTFLKKIGKICSNLEAHSVSISIRFSIFLCLSNTIVVLNILESEKIEHFPFYKHSVKPESKSEQKTKNDKKFHRSSFHMYFSEKCRVFS